MLCVWEGREGHQRVDGLCLSFFLVKGGEKYMYVCESRALFALLLLLLLVFDYYLF